MVLAATNQFSKDKVMLKFFKDVDRYEHEKQGYKVCGLLTLALCCAVMCFP